MEKCCCCKCGMMVDLVCCVFINDVVCEGCGDCLVKLNCLLVELLDMELGIKCKINQLLCNKDFLCVNGFCLSFVMVEGVQVCKLELYGVLMEGLLLLLYFELFVIQCVYGVLVIGVGGMGVVIIGGLFGMVVYIEGKGVIVFDMVGLVQKGGVVFLYVQIGECFDLIYVMCIVMGEVDLVIGCDVIVLVLDEVLLKVQYGQMCVIINSMVLFMVDFIKNLNWCFLGSLVEVDICVVVGDVCVFEDVNIFVVCLLGDVIFINLFVFGFVWQKGWVLLMYDVFICVIEFNGVVVEKNKIVFEWGCYFV